MFNERMNQAMSLLVVIASDWIAFQCYHDTSQVTEELVQKILNPGLEPGAAEVFLEFICYSDGPLPEELLPQVKCPVLIAWGDKDPWEPIELGRNYGNFDSVEDFVVLPNVGHCPQDEAPQLVNPLVESFVARHATPSTSVSPTIWSSGISVCCCFLVRSKCFWLVLSQGTANQIPHSLLNNICSSVGLSTSFCGGGSGGYAWKMWHFSQPDYQVFIMLSLDHFYFKSLNFCNYIL